ncbi:MULTISPECIES: hypothetical protein [Staphylococcus]|uniref:hypothetical protein n=1 Tax=Staphylococcus TaxID=1279 RepID=UPI0021D3E150|nr:hypothetical protein [Staphylococcus sp. IVB6181]UXV34226.1 hypothetical protein MUA90_09320 [Staphylococcus sp. IVB6181]
MEIEKIEILHIFDELFYPIFFSYKAAISKKEKVVVSVFAHYDENTETDFFLNVIVNQNTYKLLINGEIEIREVFANNVRKSFITEGSPYDFK